MATGHFADGSPRPLSERDIRLITQALIGMAAVGEKVTYWCMDNEPPEGSDVREMFYTFDQDSPTGHIIDAFLLMQYGNLTGFDHVRSLVALIRTTPVRSTTLATVTRGALEAFARSWFLLSASGPADLAHRQLSLLFSDLRYPATFGIPVATLDGDPIDPVGRRVFYASELARLELPPPIKIELSRLVADLLNSELDDGSGGRRYSDLSSIAHGHRLGVNTFVVRDEIGGIGGLVAPRDVVFEFAMELLAGISATMDAFIRVFGDNVRQADLFGAATGRAAHALSLFDESDSVG